MLNMADIIQNTHPQFILYINEMKNFTRILQFMGGRNKKMEEILQKELIYEKYRPEAMKRNTQR